MYMINTCIAAIKNFLAKLASSYLVLLGRPLLG
jgi:hypothetical protein